MTEDFYDLLGIDRDASQEEVRRAFRKQVREYHPDRNEDPRAPAQFTAIKKAYDTLGDPEEREDYDRMGHTSYCARRINGLPSPQEWQIPESESDRPDVQESVTTEPSTDDTTSVRHERQRTRNRSATGANPNSTGNANAAGSPSATAAGSAGTGRTRARGPGTSGGSPTGSVRRGVEWFSRVGLGWPLIVISDAIYLSGLVLYLAHNAPGVQRLLQRFVTASVGRGSVTEVLIASNGVGHLSSYIAGSGDRISLLGGTLLILGIASLPSVYFFIIRETRRTRTPWQPSYLYVVAAFGPVTGLLLDALLVMPGAINAAIFYVALPLLCIVGLPFSAFVLPRIRRSIRKTRHRIDR